MAVSDVERLTASSSLSLRAEGMNLSKGKARKRRVEAPAATVAAELDRRLHERPSQPRRSPARNVPVVIVSAGLPQEFFRARR
jgi:hypothetical protein